MISFADAECALRGHEEEIFSDPNVVYASVRQIEDRPEGDYYIEVGVKVLSRNHIPAYLKSSGDTNEVAIQVIVVVAGEISI